MDSTMSFYLMNVGSIPASRTINKVVKLLQNSRLECDGMFAHGDSRQLFETNLARMPEDWPYRYKNLNYQCNSQGYRCKEWSAINWSNSILLFGCSFIYGVGIDDKETCANHLHLRSGCEMVNLGMPGSSSMFQWINSSILCANRIQPRAVIYLWPDASRTTELLTNQQYVNTGAWSAERREFGTDWALHASHGSEYLKHAMVSVTAMWQCSTLHYTLDHRTADQIETIRHLGSYVSGPNWARDWDGKIAHPGPMVNQYWAEVMFKDLAALNSIG